MDRHARTAIVDMDENVQIRTLHRDPFDSEPVFGGVIDEVAQDLLEASTIDGRTSRTVASINSQYVGGHVVGLRYVADQAGHLSILQVQVGHTSVNAGNFEEVEHHRRESPQLARDDVDCLSGALGEIGPSTVEHFGRGAECTERRPKFMADVRRETGLSFDALLNGVGHRVERRHKTVQVVVSFSGESRFERTTGERLGSFCNASNRQQNATGRPPAEEAAEPDTGNRGNNKRASEIVQYSLQIILRKDLDILGLNTRNVDANSEVRGIAVVETLPSADSAIERGLDRYRE